jgi:hypothetical protein
LSSGTSEKTHIKKIIKIDFSSVVKKKGGFEPLDPLSKIINNSHKNISLETDALTRFLYKAGFCVFYLAYRILSER